MGDKGTLDAPVQLGTIGGFNPELNGTDGCIFIVPTPLNIDRQKPQTNLISYQHSPEQLGTDGKLGVSNDDLARCEPGHHPNVSYRTFTFS